MIIVKKLMRHLDNKMDRILDVLNYGIASFFWFMLLYAIILWLCIKVVGLFHEDWHFLSYVTGPYLGVINTIFLVLCYVFRSKCILNKKWYMSYLEMLCVITFPLLCFALSEPLSNFAKDHVILLRIIFGSMPFVISGLFYFYNKTVKKEPYSGNKITGKYRQQLDNISKKSGKGLDVFNKCLVSFFWYMLFSEIVYRLMHFSMELYFTSRVWNVILGLLNAVFLVAWSAYMPKSKLSRKWYMPFIEMLCVIVTIGLCTIPDILMKIIPYERIVGVIDICVLLLFLVFFIRDDITTKHIKM